jgi:hypothetical protein
VHTLGVVVIVGKRRQANIEDGVSDLLVERSVKLSVSCSVDFPHRRVKVRPELFTGGDGGPFFYQVVSPCVRCPRGAACWGLVW